MNRSPPTQFSTITRSKSIVNHLGMATLGDDNNLIKYAHDQMCGPI